MTTKSKELAVSVREVTKTYSPAPGWLKVLVKSPIKSEIVALDSVSMEVGRGEICALVGPNGAGKTTLFRILVGLTTPTRGQAQVLGHDVVDESLAIRQQIGWMPASERTLFERHTSSENLRFHGRLRGLTGIRLEKAVSETLDMVGIGHAANNSVVSFSAGMRARLQLARALLHRPKLLVLDEPTASVDPVASYELISLILDIVRDQGLSAIVSSHRLDEIEALGSHVVLLHQGRTLFDGGLDRLRSRIDRPHVMFEFASEKASRQAVAVLRHVDDVEACEIDGAMLSVVVRHGAPLGRVLQALDGRLEELVMAREVSVPLREVLAEVYGVAEHGKGPR